MPTRRAAVTNTIRALAFAVAASAGTIPPALAQIPFAPPTAASALAAYANALAQFKALLAEPPENWTIEAHDYFEQITATLTPGERRYLEAVASLARTAIPIGLVAKALGDLPKWNYAVASSLSIDPSDPSVPPYTDILTAQGQAACAACSSGSLLCRA